MVNPFSRYFRPICNCPQLFEIEPLSEDQGYFAFGEGTVCYGRTSRGFRTRRADERLYDAYADLTLSNNNITLPFDPLEVVSNLSLERYVTNGVSSPRKMLRTLARDSYYAMRPLLPLALRSHLQSFYLRGWEKLTFPAWPVDTTVEALMKKLLALQLTSTEVPTLPFIWFWPDGASACAIMTHDVEEEHGRAFCSTLMDINDEFRIPASFQIVPEKRYSVSPAYLEEIRSRGYEINVQDLNHDGRLFWELEEFKRRAEKINEYGRQFGAIGFRAAILYRNQEWFNLLDFEYDMSIPNVAHLDPQRGGCCTVMPFFIGDMVELPVTASQDHTVFHILHEYSLDLWKRQIEKIYNHHGLISFIMHPDYIIEDRPRGVYRDLLSELSRLRQDENVWIARPGEVNLWWRERNNMSLERRNEHWVIEGPGKERARVAVASLQDGRVVFDLSGQ